MANYGASEDQIFKGLQQMTVNDEDVNILLLGETGVGKSTFINSFANYLQFEKFSVAEKSEVQCCIPAKFTVSDDNLEERIVEIGSDNNENSTIYKSATLETRSYLFPVSRNGVNRVRLIDTPGIGDVRGIDQDNENMENILSYIGHLENLHAICFLLKPNNARLTVMFHYCIKQLLSRLEKSASKNIIFLFTNTRSTFYKPGDTTTALKQILEDIRSKPPHVDIKYTQDNVFCLDNESFRYLVAVRNCIQLGHKESFAQSWTHSVKECWRMIDFITGKGNSTIKIVPHKVKDTLSVNDARKTILQLSQPLADIADLINDNIVALERHNRTLNTDNLSLAELKQNLYVPVINLRCKELTQPTTVCTAQKCCEVYVVAGVNKYHYKQRCHDPCYLQNVPREIIGSPEIVQCWAMSNRKCRICSCDFSTHMHIYYISETYEDKIDNQGVKAQIKDRETALNETKKMITKIENVKQSYEAEKDTIIKTMAKFAHFLQRNAIAPYNDSYKGYIEYLIDREKSQGVECNGQVIKYYNELLKRYDEEKNVLDEALNSTSGSVSAVTARTVIDSVQNLFRLPNIGKKIKELCTKQAHAQTSEHKNTEMVLDRVNQNIRQTKFDQNKKKNKNQQQQKNKNQYQNQNDRVKMGINQHDRPNMKAKDRRPDNDRGQNRYNNRGQQNIPDLRHLPTPHFRPPYMQNQYNQSSPHMQGQFDMYGPQNTFTHHSFTRPHYSPNVPNYLQGPQHGHPNFFPGQQNMFPQQFPNFPNQQQQHGNYFPPPQPDFPPNAQESYASNKGFASNKSDFAYKKRAGSNSNISGESGDPSFNKWFKNTIMNTGSDDDESPKKKENYFVNNLLKKEISEDESTDESDNEVQQNVESDNEEFKEFMRKNNLEYLVKSSSTTTNINEKGKGKTSKKNKKGKNSSNTQYSNRRGYDSDSDDGENEDTSKTKSKNFLYSWFGGKS